MKRKLLFVAALVALTSTLFLARAGVVILAGSGYNIPANTTTNFTGLAQVGTFVLSPQSIYITTQNGVTATNGITITGRLTFDGTNFFALPQTFQNPVTNAMTGQLWAVTNIALPIYGAISVTNGTSTTVSNFQAQLQY